MACKSFVFGLLVLAASLLIVNITGQTAVTISANGFNGIQRYMAAGTIMGTMTVAGGNGNYVFQDPNPQFSVLKSSTDSNQAWIINRQPVGPGTYVLALTVTDTAGLSATTTTSITVV